MVHPDASFVQRTRDIFGQRGETWLADLPSRLASLAQRWQLSLGPTFPLTYNSVVAAWRADGSEAVLKLGVPTAGLTREIHALQAYAGRGACRVLEADAAQGALLLERLRPGEALVETARAASADELGYPRDRLRDWGIAHAVLSACWSLEDHGHGWQPAIDTAEILLRL